MSCECVPVPPPPHGLSPNHPCWALFVEAWEAGCTPHLQRCELCNGGENCEAIEWTTYTEYLHGVIDDLPVCLGAGNVPESYAQWAADLKSNLS